MKKLLLFSLVSLAIPAVAMQPAQNIPVPSEGLPAQLYIHPVVNRFIGDDAPTGSAVMHIVHDDKPEIMDYPRLPSDFTANPALAQSIDSNGRNVIWWAAC